MNRAIHVLAAVAVIAFAQRARAESPQAPADAGAQPTDTTNANAPARASTSPTEASAPTEATAPATPSAPPDAEPTAAPPTPQPAKPSRPAGVRVDGGYALRTLVSIPVTGADMGFAAGTQPSRSTAVWGATRLFIGSTENGLSVFSARLGSDAELVIDRFRLGAGIHAFVVGIGRETRDKTILSWGPGGGFNARLDVIREKGFSLFARAAIDGGFEVYSSTAFWGPTLGAGVDVDVAGKRSSPAPASPAPSTASAR